MCRMGLGNGKNQTPIAQKNTGKRIQGLSGRRQYFIKEGIPEEKLQQYRNILKDLNINGRQSGDQPIRR